MTEREIILSNEYADIISDFNLAVEDPSPVTGSVYPIGEEYASIPIENGMVVNYVDRKVIPPLSVSTYTYLAIPKLYGLMQEVTRAVYDPGALVASGILKAQRPPLSLTGRGVILGFIDTGIQYEEEIFRWADGSSRILAIWDQTIQTGTAPEGLYYGTEYTKEDIERALASDNPRDIVLSYDTDGHGTAMASVAAGSSIDSGVTYVGAAPEAELVIVKCKQAKQYLREYYLIGEEVNAYQENDIMLAVKYLERYTLRFQRPLVICLGMGTNMGDHAGNSLLAHYMNRVAERSSRAIVVCGGNEGNSAHSDSNSASLSDGSRNYDEAEIRVDNEVYGFHMEIWGNIPYTHSILIRSPGGETTDIVTFRSSESRLFTFVFERTRITVDHVLIEQSSGEELIVLRFLNPTAGVWTIRVYTEGNRVGNEETYNMWLPIKAFLTGDTYFLEPMPYITLTEPSMAREVITTSTYNDVNGSFYAESGRGFARNGDIKPDIAAPGVNVDTILGERTGSSIGAAITAGAVAQFMQWAVVERNNPWVSTGEVKNYLIRGANRKPELTYPNREWGYGTLDIYNIFETLRG